jgi:hypothetical protein
MHVFMKLVIWSRRAAKETIPDLSEFSFLCAVFL